MIVTTTPTRVATAGPGSVARLDLDPSVCAQLTETLEATTATVPSRTCAIEPAIRAALDQLLAVTLAEPLRSLRHHLGPAALVIDGLPLIDEPGPTPVDGQSTDPCLPAAKSIVAWLAERMGVFLCGYPTIAGGRFFHDVNPVRNTARPLSSKGAELALPPHCDSAAYDHRPDYLLLWGLRPAPAGPVATTYAAGTDALALLTDEVIGVLRSESFQLQVPTIADLPADADEWSEPVALVSGPADAPEMRFHASRTRALTPAAERALALLAEAIDDVAVDIDLDRGRVLILNNRRGVHGRAGFVPTYGPDERWLLRSYLMSDPWQRRAALVDGRALAPLAPIGADR